VKVPCPSTVHSEMVDSVGLITCGITVDQKWLYYHRHELAKKLTFITLYINARRTELLLFVSHFVLQQPNSNNGCVAQW